MHLSRCSRRKKADNILGELTVEVTLGFTLSIISSVIKCFNSRLGSLAISAKKETKVKINEHLKSK